MVEDELSTDKEAGESADFEKFLASLAPDREQAALRYDHLWRAVVRFCIRRQTPDPESCADEVFEILRRRVAAGRAIEHIESYSIGVARFVVLRDSERRRRLTPLSENENEASDGKSPLESLEEQTDTEDRERCVNQCLRELPVGDRDLIVQYYMGLNHDRQRREVVAARFGLSAGNLRIKIHRLKKDLGNCLDRCLK